MVDVPQFYNGPRWVQAVDIYDQEVLDRLGAIPVVMRNALPTDPSTFKNSLLRVVDENGIPAGYWEWDPWTLDDDKANALKQLAGVLQQHIDVGFLAVGDSTDAANWDTWNTAVQVNNWRLQSLINAATDATSVYAVDLTSGWP